MTMSKQISCKMRLAIASYIYIVQKLQIFRNGVNLYNEHGYTPILIKTQTCICVYNCLYVPS